MAHPRKADQTSRLAATIGSPDNQVVERQIAAVLRAEGLTPPIRHRGS
jgi:hypothetical protein